MYTEPHWWDSPLIVGLAVFFGMIVVFSLFLTCILALLQEMVKDLCKRMDIPESRLAGKGIFAFLVALWALKKALGAKSKRDSEFYLSLAERAGKLIRESVEGLREKTGTSGYRRDADWWKNV